MSFSKDVPRCARCRLHVGLCLCDDVALVATHASIEIAGQVLDYRRPSNTARLAEMACGARVSLVGLREAPFEPATLLTPGRRHVVLHPHDDAPLLHDDGRPVALLVPDGSWRQSTKIARRLAALPGVERARVDPRPSPGLRRRPRPDHACTAEAIAAALDALGEPVPARALRAALALIVERTRASRGRDPRRGSRDP